MKKLSSALYEIKFNNGNRIYYIERMINGEVLILTLRGNKNRQDKDIKKAQEAAEKIHDD